MKFTHVIRYVSVLLIFVHVIPTPILGALFSFCKKHVAMQQTFTSVEVIANGAPSSKQIFHCYLTSFQLNRLIVHAVVLLGGKKRQSKTEILQFCIRQ